MLCLLILLVIVLWMFSKFGLISFTFYFYMLGSMYLRNSFRHNELRYCSINYLIFFFFFIMHSISWFSLFEVSSILLNSLFFRFYIWKILVDFIILKQSLISSISLVCEYYFCRDAGWFMDLLVTLFCVGVAVENPACFYFEPYKFLASPSCILLLVSLST